jgi:hypothetical protein
MPPDQHKGGWEVSAPLARVLLLFLVVLAVSAAFIGFRTASMVADGYDDLVHYVTLAISVVVPLAALLAVFLFVQMDRGNRASRGAGQ